MDPGTDPGYDVAAEARTEHELVTLRLRVAGTVIEARAPMPDGPITVANLVPLLQGVEEAVVGTVAERVAEAGARVSCRAGCGACCRQLVPISVAEAHRLADLVEAMPAERRARVRARFADAVERLAGLAGALAQAIPGTDPEALHALGMRYFLLGVPCPFLEDESCGIHPERPLACREYLVTSPAAHCAAPEDHPIERVAVPRDVSRALYRLGDGSDAPTTRWVPLVLALEWTADAAPLPVRPARELLERFFAALTPPPAA